MIIYEIKKILSLYTLKVFKIDIYIKKILVIAQFVTV